ncbi:MAG: hypothetical protein IE935_16635, partial [Micrococcales bacterium]|nr:hypothetical protein [Micrococcales bacterium]
MRIVFAGTPEPAVLSLRALVDAGHEVPLVITRPDAQIGRRRVVTPSPVATAADTLGLSAHRTARLDDVALEAVRAAHPDLGVIVAYGGLVREPLLSTPRHGWINLHFSALPRWRGAAPVQHAIIAGDPEVGVDVFQLTAGLDEGDIFGEVRFPRPIAATAGELLATLADAGAELLTTVVGQIADGTARSRPQAGDPSYAPKLSIEDGRVDWQQSREQIMSRILGVTPEPGAFATAQDAREIFIVDSSDGYGIDACVASGASCGQAMADAWCRVHDYERAVGFGKVKSDATISAVSTAPVRTACYGAGCAET